ncbi:ABC transporter permease [Streptomyces sp. NRRL B-24484]|uniref:ABC transporter permease n=1 Tax=Streptomyces sp. NRRL B-24484 TaxID=1463833 RepID=UPI0004BF264B|nr:ABC transporter permease [Streptomyces sp. NRRL B-24484]
MTTPAATAATSAAGRPAATTTAGRLLALGRSEATLLLRNRTALFMAVAMPLVMMVTLKGILDQQAETTPDLDLHANLVNGVAGLILLFVVYYNLTTAYVARRGELVLKRLRTGEARDLEILAGTALPSVALGLLECGLIGAVGAARLDLRTPVNPLLMAAGLLLCTGLLIALAAATSAFTKSVETAGITTLPLLLFAQIGSGLLIPLETMPDGLATACRLLPTTPAFQLIRLGWFGTDGSDAPTDFLGTWVEALPHLGLGVLWLAAAVWAARRWFRWEPRR